MNDDKELVEVWIEQFESWAYDYPGDALSKEYLKQAWIAAKRSQPIVVLPKPEVCFGNKPFAYVLLDPLCDNLTAAGIKYTIGN